ncbi:MAG: hypothetical protein JSW16_07045 [Dehalococcoidales bacterium]|nr:MAG: hypothetical protein JSW16_07045 [Dehalococcoidales bacterium]
MPENINDTLMLLKGFTFDGDTGRTIQDLYSAVTGTGCTKDTPFAMPSWVEGDEKPVAVNSYLDPEGKRVHIIWRSDTSGLSRVIDVVLNAPSLAKDKPAEASCDVFHIDMMEMIQQIAEEETGQNS